MAKHTKVDLETAKTQTYKNTCAEVMGGLANIQEKLGLSDKALAKKMCIEAAELDAWREGRGRPLMDHINAIQRDVLDFNEALGATRAAKEGIDLKQIRKQIADLDRVAGQSPYRGNAGRSF